MAKCPTTVIYFFGDQPCEMSLGTTSCLAASCVQSASPEAADPALCVPSITPCLLPLQSGDQPATGELPR